ncbi:MAG: carbamoyltransferase [Brevinematales bacterium]|nr:carbamoyltransferase [Brevinematales bacterium]
MVILGISAFYHDSAAALVRDGEIVAAAQQERFSRKKGDESFPREAIAYCLDEAGVSIQDVDYVVFYDKPLVKFDRILASYIHTAPKGIRSFLMAIPVWIKQKLWVEEYIRKELAYKGTVLFSSHHQAHAASAFYPSPFERAAILTVDGAGEWNTTTIGYGERNRITLLKHIDFPHSLGLLYSAFTYYCGFKVNSGEYKLMGLAPYGEPKYVDVIKNHILTIREDGSFELNERYFDYISGLTMISRQFEKLFGQKALPQGGTPTPFYMDVAASIQAVTTEILVKMARYAKQITGERYLCLAGGVALNCVANSRILLESGFEDVWIQPAAGDAGGALGAALAVWYGYLGRERKVDGIHDSQKGSYLGPSYAESKIQEILDAYGAVYEKLGEEELLRKTAQAIADGKVVGWFQGRSEFGPRALGNRSILGDARREDMQTTMNLKIKFRESFRPFAPAVLAEDVGQWFEWEKASPYMLFVANVRKEHRLAFSKEGKTGLDLLKQPRSVLQAITHVDFSARLQTVHRETNPKFYALLEEFKRLTGCSVIINTSFNVRGEPIVNDPRDAYRCFMGTHIDVLVIGNFYLEKSHQPPFQELHTWKSTLIAD